MRSTVIEFLQLGGKISALETGLLWLEWDPNDVTRGERLRALFVEAKRIGGNGIVFRNLDKIKAVL